MITIIFFFLLGLVLGYRFLLRCFDKLEDKLFFSFICGVFGIFIGVIFSSIIPSKTYFEKSTFELESISDGNEFNGQFFLGSGYINSRMKYSFYLKESEGFKLYTIDSNLAHIRYKEGKPILEMFEKKRTKDFINFFSLKDRDEVKYIIYVPSGSILQNYVLDSNL